MMPKVMLWEGGGEVRKWGLDGAAGGWEEERGSKGATMYFSSMGRGHLMGRRHCRFTLYWRRFGTSYARSIESWAEVVAA